MNLSPSLNGRYTWLTVTAVIIVQIVVFSAAVGIQYAHRDDYIAMQFHSINFDWLHSVYAMDGRMLLGLLNGIFFDHSTTIESLNSIRMAGLAGSILFSLTLLGMLRQTCPSECACATGALAGGLTLASVVYVGWTICFALSFAAILSLGSGMLFTQIFFGNKWRRVGIALLACALFVAATLIYQGTTPLFLVPAFFALIREDSAKRFVLKMGLFLIAFAGYSLIYLAVFKGYSAILFEANPRAGRVLTEIDLPAILANLRRLSLMTLNLNVATPSVWVPGLALTGALGFLLFHSRGALHGLLLLLVLLAITLAGFIPSISSSNQMSDYRTFIASQVITLTTVAIGWHGILKWIVFKLRGHNLLGAALPAVLIIVAVAGSARYHLLNGLVRPSRDEHQIILNYTQANFPERPEAVTYVLSKWHFPLLTNGLGTAEFGKINSNNRVNARWFLEYVFDEAYVDAPNQTTRFTFLKKPPPGDHGQVVMDSTAILTDGLKQK